jgi:pentatricopeptide repeat protein
MSTTYKTLPELEYYTCMVDLLCCARHLQEAENMIKVMIFYKPNVAVWMVLLCACRIHGNVEIPEHVAK